jgi:hypothetical protein
MLLSELVTAKGDQARQYYLHMAAPSYLPRRARGSVSPARQVAGGGRQSGSHGTRRTRRSLTLRPRVTRIRSPRAQSSTSKTWIPAFRYISLSWYPAARSNLGADAPRRDRQHRDPRPTSASCRAYFLWIIRARERENSTLSGRGLLSCTRHKGLDPFVGYSTDRMVKPVIVSS